jgi:hypothetical protein
LKKEQRNGKEQGESPKIYAFDLNSTSCGFRKQLSTAGAWWPYAGNLTLFYTGGLGIVILHVTILNHTGFPLLCNIGMVIYPYKSSLPNWRSLCCHTEGGRAACSGEGVV